MFRFRCKHPFDALRVYGQHEIETVDQDFERVVYRFTCADCGKHLRHTHIRTVGGIEAFMQRGLDAVRAKKSPHEAG